jgi:modulator of drug activity B
MKNALIINGHQYWEIAKGEYNKTLVEYAREQFARNGYSVKSTHIEDDYDVAEEVEKMMRADIVIFQTPVYWMSIPWGFKKYIDEVYMGGYGRMFTDDGRTRTDPTRKYGSGGLMKGRKYMLSTTWNAPSEAFNDEKQFFQGKSVDGVFFSFHKSQHFLGLEQLPTFSCYDVLKSPDMERDLQRYGEHLKKVFDFSTGS